MDDQPVARRKITSDGVDIRGKTKLHKLASRGCVTPVSRLLNQGCSVNVVDNKGRTPLHYAAHSGHIDVVRVLIKANTLVNAADKHGSTALMVSARKGHSEIVEMLVNSGAALEAADTRGYTALHESAYHGHRQTVKVLLKAGAPVDAVDILDGTPLHASAYQGLDEVVEALLMAHAYIDAVDSCGQTPLHKSAMRGHSKSVQILVKWKSSLGIKDRFGDTPQQVADRGGHCCIAAYLQSVWSSLAFTRQSDMMANSNRSSAHLVAGHGTSFTETCPEEVPSALTSQAAPEPPQPPVVQFRRMVDSTSKTQVPCAQEIGASVAAPIQRSVIETLKQVCSDPDIYGSDVGRGLINVTLVVNCHVYTEKVVVRHKTSIKTQEVNVEQLLKEHRPSTNLYQVFLSRGISSKSLHALFIPFMSVFGFLFHVFFGLPLLFIPRGFRNKDLQVTLSTSFSVCVLSVFVTRLSRIYK